MIWSSNSFRFFLRRRAVQGAARAVLWGSTLLLVACAQLPVTTAPTAVPSAPNPAALIDNVTQPVTASVQQGWRILFDQRLGNCAACHSIPNEQGKKSGIQSTFAPALDGVATRYSPVQLRQWVVDARKINPNTMMPPFGQILTPQQVTDVLAALHTLR
jgi:sulfur oxidation c-type cytochrome SoxX